MCTIVLNFIKMYVGISFVHPIKKLHSFFYAGIFLSRLDREFFLERPPDVI